MTEPLLQRMVSLLTWTRRIYFAIDSQGVVLYISETEKLTSSLACRSFLGSGLYPVMVLGSLVKYSFLGQNPQFVLFTRLRLLEAEG
jgi:hypothetical protein